MSSVIVSCLESELDEPGRNLLSACRHQNTLLAQLLQPRGNVIYVTLSDTTHPEHAVAVRLVYGSNDREWQIPAEIVQEVQAGRLGGAAAINRAGTALLDYCRAEGCSLWHDPDWITQSEAAALVNVSLARISNAVRDGRLLTWENVDEANPRRRTRVRRSDVLRLWPSAGGAEKQDS